MEKRLIEQAEWQRTMERHAASGLTIPAFCAENDIPLWRFCYWRRRLRRLQALSPEKMPELLPVPAEGGSVPLRQEPEPGGHPDSGISLQTGKLRILLGRDFDGATLKRVLEIAEASTC